MATHHARSAKRMRVFAALCTMSLAAFSTVANTGIEGVFSEAGDALSLPTPISPDVPSVQRRIVRMDFGQLETARREALAGRTANLTLNLFDELSFRGIVERTAATSSGYSLSGKLEDMPFGTMALVLNDEIVVGKVRTLDAVFTIRSIGPGTYVIERTEPTEFVECEPLKPPPPISDLGARADARVTEEDDGSEIDVFVAWTPAARRDAGGIRHIETWIDLRQPRSVEPVAASIYFTSEASPQIDEACVGLLQRVRGAPAAAPLCGARPPS